MSSPFWLHSTRLVVMHRYRGKPVATLARERVGIRLAAHRRAVGCAAILALGLVVEGCYPKVGPDPGTLSPAITTAAAARWPGVTASTLVTGHDLFLARCNGCHGYPDLVAIPDERWPAIVEKMGNKIHLNAEERDQVLHYILASRSDPAR
jgi:mono/diheme cytochrome c family protein